MKTIISNLCAMTIIVLLSITVAILFTACRKECITCVAPPPDLIEKVAFNLMDKSMQEEFRIYQGNIKGGYYREQLFIYEKDNMLDFIKQYCLSKNIPVDEQTIGVVLYYKEPVSPTFTVTDENIQGLSVYSVEKRKLMHHLFIKNEQSDFYEIENTKVAVPTVSTNYIHFYLENYVFENPQNRSYIVISGPLHVSEAIRKAIKRTPRRFEIKTAAKAHPGQQYTCSSPCAAGGVGDCDPVRSLYCEGSTSCAGSDVHDRLSEANMMEKMLIDLDLMYAFRDDVLYHSEKGEVYIDNYYYLSEEYDGKISLALAIKSALFFKDFNPVMRAFINPEGHLKEIMFTDNLSNSLLNLLDEYEKITSSSEGKAILASIRKDVHSFKNKQLQEILAMIK